MISKLRKQFVLINMSLVTFVLVIVFTVSCHITYNQTRSDTDGALRRMYDTSFRDKRPQPFDSLGVHNIPPMKSENTDGMQNNNPPEPPQDINQHRRKSDSFGVNSQIKRIPMFAALIDQSGNIVLKNSENMTVDDELLAYAADYVKQAHDDEGAIKSVNLRYLRRFEPQGECIVFADITNEISVMKNVVVVSICTGLGALAAFLVISIFLSGIVVRPVKAAWDKQRQFVADASHELKTPLTVILANMNILNSNSTETVQSQSKWIANTVEEAERMKVLVDEMLFLAKSDAHKHEAVYEKICISDILMGCILQFESVAFEKGVRICDDIEENVSIIGSHQQLGQLVGILLDNACKYADVNTNVTVSLKKEQGAAVISVNNKGAVIPKDELGHIFERFYRSEKSRVRKTGGYGLGLAIALSIAEFHGGKINAASNETDGTTFTVKLPMRYGTQGAKGK